MFTLYYLQEHCNYVIIYEFMSCPDERDGKKWVSDNLAYPYRNAVEINDLKNMLHSNKSFRTFCNCIDLNHSTGTKIILKDLESTRSVHFGKYD